MMVPTLCHSGRDTIVLSLTGFQNMLQAPAYYWVICHLGGCNLLNMQLIATLYHQTFGNSLRQDLESHRGSTIAVTPGLNYN